MDLRQRHNITIGGTATGQPMLLAHGFGCDQQMWRFVEPAFADRYRTVRFDHAGAGRSDPEAWSRDRHSSLQGYAEDVLAICRELELTDVVFVGHSVSAMVGVLAARQEPERFASLVLIGPSPRYIDDEGYTGGFASVDSTMNGWVTRNGCGATSAVYFDEGDVTCEEWTGCDDGASVRLCTVDGGGHQWPGGATLPGLGSNTDVVVATDAMWDFFAAHSL